MDDLIKRKDMIKQICIKSVGLALVACVLMTGCGDDEPAKDPTPPVISDVKILENGDTFVTLEFNISNPDGALLQDVGVTHGLKGQSLDKTEISFTNINDTNKTVSTTVTLDDDTEFDFKPYVKYGEKVVEATTISGFTFSSKWKMLKEFPGEARAGAVSFAIGEKVYVGLGSKTFGVHTNDDNFADFWSYNVTSDEWTKLSDFPGGARSLAFAFTLEGIGYVGGGRNMNTTLNKAIPELWKYDPSTDTWVQQNNLPQDPGFVTPTAFLYPIVASGPGLAYYGSGFSGSASGQSFAGFMYRYNQSDDSWTEVPRSPKPAGGCSSFILGNRLFFGACPDIEGTSRFFRLNFMESVWVEQASIPGIAKIRESEFGGKGFSIGDFGYIIDPFGQIFKYDVVNNSWEQIVKYSPLLKGINATFGTVGAVVNGKAYVGMGSERATTDSELIASKKWAVFDASK